MLPTIHRFVEHPRVIEDVPGVDLVVRPSTGTTDSDTRSALAYHPRARYPAKRRHREHRPDERLVNNTEACADTFRSCI
jgi:hypothetical protein